MGRGVGFGRGDVSRSNGMNTYTFIAYLDRPSHMHAGPCSQLSKLAVARRVGLVRNEEEAVVAACRGRGNDWDGVG